MRFAHVSPRTVRFWAWIDTSVIVLALPITAKAFLALIYGLNGLLGFDAEVPAFGAIQMFFVNLAGMLVAVWAIARLVHPIGLLAFIDAIGRSAVAMLIAWYALVENAPQALWLFVFTEGAGAVAQLRACLREPAPTGATLH
ncbi:hypothetical protein DFR24_4767 [Panacagrimonas perspica]|uniref:Uncharacterized protein n=1 Tax=Panacagrimonas perspica TaxID=381431 RepID=A0A4R7NQK9_9GAMM|nr:hypothetical protein [Panacagrimonas perspica]TDU23244.1 hypothetical protein DFR24_4767 [Panacagrimonas perspica]